MLYVYDNNYQRVGILDPDSTNGLTYYDDKLTTSISNGLYSLELKVPKNTPKNSVIRVGNMIEERTMHGKQLLLTISNIVENKHDKTVFAEDASINLLNGFVDAIQPPNAPEDISYYANHIIENTGWKIGIVELKNSEKLEFSQPQRRLERLRNLAESFDAELDFETNFIPGSPPSMTVHFLKRRVEDDDGFRISSDDLLLNVERTIDLYNVISKLIVRGKQYTREGESETDKKSVSAPVVKEPPKDTFVETAISRAFEIKALGRRYQWGGNGNPSWDCSGFMQECFKAAGKTIDHRWTTYTMWSQQGGHFKRISKSELKRGDCIMYDTGYTYPGDVNHVGLYLGPTLDSPNSVIHAGDPVGITQKANSMKIIGYTRVVR